MYTVQVRYAGNDEFCFLGNLIVSPLYDRVNPEHKTIFNNITDVLKAIEIFQRKSAIEKIGEIRIIKEE